MAGMRVLSKGIGGRRKLVSRYRIAMPAFLAILLVTSVIPMCALEPTAETVRLPLVELAGSEHAAATAALEAVKAEVEVSTVQPAAGGLHLILTFSNSGTEPVRFFEPSDTTSVLLLNEEGWPIGTPRRIPRALDDRPHTPEERARDRVKVIVLAPGETFRLPIAVTEVLPAKDEEEGGDPQPIPAGTYQASVMTTLVLPVTPPNDAEPPTYSLESEKFTVRLTAAALP